MEINITCNARRAFKYKITSYHIYVYKIIKYVIKLNEINNNNNVREMFKITKDN